MFSVDVPFERHRYIPIELAVYRDPNAHGNTKENLKKALEEMEHIVIYHLKPEFNHLKKNTLPDYRHVPVEFPRFKFEVRARREVDSCLSKNMSEYQILLEDKPAGGGP